MIKLQINHTFAYEMENTLRIFYPGERIEAGEASEDESLALAVIEADDGARSRLYARIRMDGFDRELREELELVHTPIGDPRERGLARLLFRLLCRQTGRRPPWGILTGVRPVRLCNTMLSHAMTREEVARFLEEEYLVLPEKIRLTLLTGETEQSLLDKADSRGYSLYIGIPFCPSRCLYCSFVSHDIEKAAKLVPAYLDCLCRELEEIARLARELSLRLQSVYIGGGTPTTLEPAQLDRILATVDRCFQMDHLLEYTVEAGRPDTITQEKLRTLRRWGVDRISVNPQTLNDEVLRNIGRSHTAAEALRSVALAREAGFAVLNMDLIAGLPGDTRESFLATVEGVLALEPENITIHTLTVKRSSSLRERENAFAQSALDLSRLLDESRSLLLGRNYRPYYLYRQKGTVQNLENVGYAHPGRESAYNVFIMEEVHTVLAAGAGATTKLFGAPDRLKRVFNYKYPYEYIERFGEMLARKASIKEFYETL